MTDRAQFEAMLEALINEDQETAKEIFHNIVVAKSREIYEELLSEDFTISENQDQGNPYESTTDEQEPVEEEFGADDDAEEDDAEADDSEEPSDDEEGEENPFGDEEGDDEGGDMEDRVMDLEDALEDLKAEFEQLLADEGDDMGGDDMGGMDDMGGDMDMEPEMPMMEYVNKVGKPTHGDNGVNTRSAVAGKNDMGGTTANIAKSFSTEKGGTQGGLANPSTKEENFGNVNVPGGNAGKTGFKKREPGHGAEKKGTGDNGDKSAGSLLNGVKSRAK